MTLREFNEAYQEILNQPDNWQVFFDPANQLRLRRVKVWHNVDYNLFDPITAVCFEKTGVWHRLCDWLVAAKALGLETKIASEIAFTSDNGKPDESEAYEEVVKW